MVFGCPFRRLPMILVFYLLICSIYWSNNNSHLYISFKTLRPIEYCRSPQKLHCCVLLLFLHELTVLCTTYTLLNQILVTTHCLFVTFFFQSFSFVKRRHTSGLSMCTFFSLKNSYLINGFLRFKPLKPYVISPLQTPCYTPLDGL